MNVDTFAINWISAWNSHDLERILDHYAEDVVFESPLIRETLPSACSGPLLGKLALRNYWSRAFERFPDLHFSLQGVFAGVGSICLYYHSVKNLDAVEWMRVDGNWMITQSAAHYSKVDA